MAEASDVVELLQQQHLRIRELMTRVADTKGEERAEVFHELVRLLVVHETAEEEVVHSYAKSKIENGEHVVGDRITEEEGIKRLLKQLAEEKNLDSPEFQRRFETLRKDVESHADKEEREEFARLRSAADRKQLEGLAVLVKAAEAVAPTHPRPGTDTAAKNLAIGPWPR
ncbi:hemerythrin domain-containing protein [Streptomyces sp. M19]